MFISLDWISDFVDLSDLNPAVIADLLRLRLDLASQLYPQISGHKSRFAIRFMPLDSEHGIVPERFDFELACC